jgi:hypothetical protein
MINFTPGGLATEFFALFGAPGTPMRWGDEDHVRGLFGDRVTLDCTRGTLVERAASPDDYVAFYKRTFGPVVAAYAAARDTAALDRDFRAFARRASRGSPAEYHYEYLLVTACVRGGGPGT